MPNINWDDQDEKDQKSIDGVALARGYQPMVADGNGNLVPNPMTKKQFATKFLKTVLREHRKLLAIQPAEEARLQALANFNNGDPEE